MKSTGYKKKIYSKIITSYDNYNDIIYILKYKIFIVYNLS